MVPRAWMSRHPYYLALPGSLIRKREKVRVVIGAVLRPDLEAYDHERI